MSFSRTIAITFLMLLSTSAAHADELLRIMSFNVRTPADTEPKRRWPDRRDAMVSLIKLRQPEVIGTQELVKDQADYLAAHLPGYQWFGRGRRGDEGDEHMGVYYDTRRVRLVESGDFWLSDTPDVAGSISWGHPYPRMVSWGLFERLGDHKRFHVINTHLPYRDEDEQARVNGARQILKYIETLPARLPVIITGDFNTEPGSRTHATFVEQLDDARQAAVQVIGPPATFHDFTGTASRQLDWILVRNSQVVRFSTLDQTIGGILPSDHFPIEADLRLPE